VIFLSTLLLSVLITIALAGLSTMAVGGSWWTCPTPGRSTPTQYRCAGSRWLRGVCPRPLWNFEEPLAWVVGRPADPGAFGMVGRLPGSARIGILGQIGGGLIVIFLGGEIRTSDAGPDGFLLPDGSPSLTLLAIARHHAINLADRPGRDGRGNRLLSSVHRYLAPSKGHGERLVALA